LRFEVEVYDPELAEWEQLDPEGVSVCWGPTRPATLIRDGELILARFRVWEIVSAGTDRWLALEAIPGLTLYERTIT